MFKGFKTKNVKISITFKKVPTCAGVILEDIARNSFLVTNPSLSCIFKVDIDAFWNFYIDAFWNFYITAFWFWYWCILKADIDASS